VGAFRVVSNLLLEDALMTGTNPREVIGGNNPPAYLAVFEEIDDLYGEAKNWADGAAIESEAQHDTVSSIRDQIHELGKRADELRVEEKRPLDEAAKAIQDRYNPYIQPKKGKVDLAKAALGDLLAAWRKRVADEKAEAARLAREEADRIAAAAQEAIRASSGNLESREKAEELLQEAKAHERHAKRQDKAATTGLGLRTTWKSELVDEAAALDHYYPLYREAFLDLVRGYAAADARGGARKIPGFRVYEERVV
jgi:hypothetical protein